ncbi:MAG: hypothetical protein IJS56_00545 [Bacilli bacterium]|nr:hypothetical protein [Bacilli bacterium]
MSAVNIPKTNRVVECINLYFGLLFRIDETIINGINPIIKEIIVYLILITFLILFISYPNKIISNKM